MNAPPAQWLRRALLVTGAPLCAGLIITLLLRIDALPNPLIRGQVTVDLGTLALLAGSLLSGVGLMVSLLYWCGLRRSTQAVADERKRWSELHRRFIHRLDHEMKTPLAVLQVGLAGRAGFEGPMDETSQPVRLAVARLGGLIQDLRKLADLETHSLECEMVDLAALVEDTIEAVRSAPGWQERSISVVTPQVPWPPAPVTGDRDMLTLAFYNLLDNACKFTRPEDTIEVRIRDDGLAVIVDVADGGPGIAVADLPYLFEELYRGQNAHGIEGSGLGLSLVKKIVDRHGGQITVRSGVGHGTMITVQLPLSQRLPAHYRVVTPQKDVDTKS